jgi:VCBS repeat-containing protein
LNYAGKFDATLPADGPGTQHSHAYVHIDSPHAQVPADAIIVPDAHLLFNADFKRSGVDLILSKDDQELVLHDYFKGEKRAPLASPDGAHLTGDLVNALTGHVQYSQAGGAPAAASQVIGHVTKLAGSATAVRNGVSIILHQGDNVEKGDVVQAGSDSTLGVTFIDGTVFGLSSNARMVLNEMVYDPNGSNNSSLISLVAGTISFVAGETAKHGDMKIDTPVATMGIRGTAVLVEIDFTVPQGANQPDAKFQVLVEPDGTTGSYILFDKTTLQPIAVVNQAGQQVNINNGVVSTSASQLSPELQKLITDVFTQKFASDDTKSNTHFTDTFNPDLITGLTIKTSSGATATPIFLVTNPGSSSIPEPLNGPSPTLFHIPQLPTVTPVGDAIKEILLTTGSKTLDLTFNKIGFTDINQGDHPTVSTSFNDFTFTDAQGHDLTAQVKNNATYAHWFADIKATEVNLVVTPDPQNTNNGSATWVYNIADSAFDFLAAGEKLTLTYTAVVDNNFTADPTTEKATQTFSIIITGTNDVPVITTGPQTINFLGGKTTPGGNLKAAGNAPTSGTLSFTDVDLSDTHTVNTKLTTATLSGPGAPNLFLVTDGNLTEDGLALAPSPLKFFESALSAALASDSTGSGNGTINWTLADLPVYLADFIPKGETLTLTYTVIVTDSQTGVSLPDTVTITVTITGNNSPAVVWIETRPAPASDLTPGDWNEGSHWETGNVPTANDDAIIITN